MKKTVMIVSLLATMATVTTANAGSSSATMKIQGEIIPATCDISFNGANSSSLSLGKIIPSQLLEDRYSALPSLNANLNITCPAATSVGFKATDIAEGAGNVKIEGSPMSNLFSLGLAPTGNLIGGYAVIISGGSVDGSGISTVLKSNSGESWSAMGDSRTIDPSNRTTYSWSSATGSSSSVPTMGRNHQISLSILPLVNATKHLGNIDNLEFIGQATYDLVYL